MVETWDEGEVYMDEHQFIINGNLIKAITRMRNGGLQYYRDTWSTYKDANTFFDP